MIIPAILIVVSRFRFVSPKFWIYSVIFNVIIVSRDLVYVYEWLVIQQFYCIYITFEYSDNCCHLIFGKFVWSIYSSTQFVIFPRYRSTTCLC